MEWGERARPGPALAAHPGPVGHPGERGHAGPDSGGPGHSQVGGVPGSLAHPQACAGAPIAEVIGVWSGLGYNRRAVFLHRAAVDIVTRHGGVVPADRAALVALPGVGAYTARAILVFAFGHPVGVVETNTARVLARGVAGSRLTRSAVQDLADRMVPPAAGWAWNQAMLDLGATVCIARRPACGACPLGPRPGRPDRPGLSRGVATAAPIRPPAPPALRDPIHFRRLRPTGTRPAAGPSGRRTRWGPADPGRLRGGGRMARPAGAGGAGRPRARRRRAGRARARRRTLPPLTDAGVPSASPIEPLRSGIGHTDDADWKGVGRLRR